MHVHTLKGIDRLTDTTYFGLPVVVVDGNKFVRISDIKKLPFFNFWDASAIGSTLRASGDEKLVCIADWEAFSELFIRTGKHRYQ